MNKMYMLAFLAVTLASCDTLTNPSLKGKYQYIGRDHRMHILDKFELTPTKFVMPGMFGEAAMDYKVEDGFVYAGPDGGQIRFKIVSTDTLRNEGTMGMEGDYVRVNN